MNRDERNPLFIPSEGEAEEQLQGCPQCGKSEWTGRNLGGTLRFTCKACGHQWTGGLPQMPADPRIPTAPSDPRDIPTVRFTKNNKGEFDELRRRPSTVQPFRTGAPIKDDEEEI
jgi:hypothetical protein